DGGHMAEYDLKDVIAAAKQNKIIYRGSKVYHNIAALGYDDDDVSYCLENLSESDFSKTICYSEDSLSKADDVYIVSYTKTIVRDVGEKKYTDKLYIKFSLLDGCLDIDLGSFHLS
ncbi:MAG: type II toxin-antitoxin system MqsR family toxin, partial [Proteobacteria bacterium]|nr:type II toxin-antitoxin system MqsR family toxin [Pseudomonadota bacterium]